MWENTVAIWLELWNEQDLKYLKNNFKKRTKEMSKGRGVENIHQTTKATQSKPNRTKSLIIFRLLGGLEGFFI